LFNFEYTFNKLFYVTAVGDVL